MRSRHIFQVGAWSNRSDKLARRAAWTLYSHGQDEEAADDPRRYFFLARRLVSASISSVATPMM
jgi:hypothetical protein